MAITNARRGISGAAERTSNGLKHVAAATGFGSVDVMRRAFVRLIGMTPRQYRELSARQAD